MKLTQEQAAELITSVANAAIYHNEDHALLDEGQTAFAALAWALSAVDDVDLTDEERDQLRVLAGRAITDPTTYRSDFVDHVLSALPDEAETLPAG